MPLYGYVCRDCGGAFEVLVRGGEDVSCTKCGSLALTRQVSAAAPLTGSTPAPAGCGMSSCCMAQGGCCPN